MTATTLTRQALLAAISDAGRAQLRADKDHADILAAVDAAYSATVDARVLLGRAIRTLRQAERITYKDIAAETGVSVKRIQSSYGTLAKVTGWADSDDNGDVTDSERKAIERYRREDAKRARDAKKGKNTTPGNDDNDDNNGTGGTGGTLTVTPGLAAAPIAPTSWEDARRALAAIALAAQNGTLNGTNGSPAKAEAAAKRALNAIQAAKLHA